MGRRHIATRNADGAALLDAIGAALGLATDVELARWLEAQPSTLSHVRIGRYGLSDENRIKVLDAVGLLGPTRLAQLLTPEALLEGYGAAQDDGRPWQGRLLDAAKDRLDCATDRDLADRLGLTPNALSMARHGRVGLGIRPRLLLRQQVSPWVALTVVQQALDSTGVLLDLVQRYSARPAAA